MNENAQKSSQLKISASLNSNPDKTNSQVKTTIQQKLTEQNAGTST